MGISEEAKTPFCQGGIPLRRITVADVSTGWGSFGSLLEVFSKVKLYLASKFLRFKQKISKGPDLFHCFGHFISLRWCCNVLHFILTHSNNSQFACYIAKCSCGGFTQAKAVPHCSKISYFLSPLHKATYTVNNCLLTLDRSAAMLSRLLLAKLICLFGVTAQDSRYQ